MDGDPMEPLREPPVRGVEQHDGAVVVRLGGELDLYNADDVRRVLVSAVDEGAGCIVVDMSEVGFVDSTALGVLVEVHSKLGQGRLLIAAPQPETRRTLEVSGLDRHLPVHDTVDGALASASS